MNRLRTHCLVASLSGHGVLLILLLVAGPAFVTRPPPIEVPPVVNFVPDRDFMPDRLVEAPVVGGGDPRGTPRPSPQAPSQPAIVQPPPARVSTPNQPVQTAERKRTEPTRSEPKKPVAPRPRTDHANPDAAKKPASQHKIEVNRDPVTRTPSPTAKKSAKEAEKKAAEAARRAEREAAEKKAAEREAAEREAAEQEAAEREAERQAFEQARAYADARRGQIQNSIRGLQGQLSSRSLVVVPYGPGGGGETYAGYGLFVRMIYDRAWRDPANVPEGNAVVTVRVVVGRDGRVISAEIQKKSGIAAVDKSVKAALDRVPSIGHPFPEGVKDEQKTFLIDFDLKAKRDLG